MWVSRRLRDSGLKIRARAMSMEDDAATALHLPRDVLDLGEGIVAEIQVSSVRLVLTPKIHTHGDPAKAPRHERQDAVFQRLPPLPPPDDPANLGH